MVPIYSLASILGLGFPEQAFLFDSVRDFYESFVLYNFLSLLLVYAGGEQRCAEGMQADPGYIEQPYPFTRFGAIPTNAVFLRHCKQAVLQFILVKPVMAVISLVMIVNGEYHSYIYQTVLAVVYNISYSLALYMLVLFYLATHKQLTRFNPIRKFASVKLVVFFTFWQTFVISKLPNLTRAESASIQDYLLCIEMSVFAVFQYFAFNASEFYDVQHIGFQPSHGMESSTLKSLHTSATADSISDTDSQTSSMSREPNKHHTSTKPFKKHMGTLAKTLDLTDVYNDTKRSFNPRYNQYNHYSNNDVEIGAQQADHSIQVNNTQDSASNQSIFTTLFNGNRHHISSTASNSASHSSQLLSAEQQLSARHSDDNDTDAIQLQSYHNTDPLHALDEQQHST